MERKNLQLILILVRSNGIGNEKMMGEKVTYFVNKQWPEIGTGLEFATHSIRVKDEDICQIRYWNGTVGSIVGIEPSHAD